MPLLYTLYAPASPCRLRSATPTGAWPSVLQLQLQAPAAALSPTLIGLPTKLLGHKPPHILLAISGQTAGPLNHRRCCWQCCCRLAWTCLGCSSCVCCCTTIRGHFRCAACAWHFAPRAVLISVLCAIGCKGHRQSCCSCSGGGGGCRCCCRHRRKRRCSRVCVVRDGQGCQRGLLGGGAGRNEHHFHVLSPAAQAHVSQRVRPILPPAGLLAIAS